MIFVANVDIKAQNIKANEGVEVTLIEDLGYQCVNYPCLIQDPIIDGLIYLRHPDAPWSTSAREFSQKLADRWQKIVTEDALNDTLEDEKNVLNAPTPGEKMIGTKFCVLCWKDYGPCKAGQIYDVVITDYYGFGCDGFLIELPNADLTEPDFLNVDMVQDAINHFVLV